MITLLCAQSRTRPTTSSDFLTLYKVLLTCLLGIKVMTQLMFCYQMPLSAAHTVVLNLASLVAYFREAINLKVLRAHIFIHPLAGNLDGASQPPPLTETKLYVQRHTDTVPVEQ